MKFPHGQREEESLKCGGFCLIFAACHKWNNSATRLFCAWAIRENWLSPARLLFSARVAI
jgi:hypothetical protein